MKEFLEKLGDGYKHASNYKAKLKNKDNLEDLLMLFAEYKTFDNIFKEFKIENAEEIVNAWNSYLSFVRKRSKYSAQSKFESTIMEEALFRIFKSHESENIKVGGIKAYSNMYFSPSNFETFKSKLHVKINTKDQDFAIFRNVKISINTEEEVEAFVPVIAIECKTYLDKTMLEGSIATAEKIKQGNPYCRFCIVTESYDVDYAVEIKHSRIDQIYVLSKSKRKKDSKDSNIQSDVISQIYRDTTSYLEANWSDIESNITKHGKVL
jgi:hypothetical protein